MSPTVINDDNLNPNSVVNEAVEELNLDISDDELVRRVVKTLQSNIDHWEQVPWQLTRTDRENINYLLGDQLDEKYLLPHQARYVDNRLHASVRAILAYTTGQQAKPELIPSKTDDKSKRVASSMESFLYQHALDHEANGEMRLAVKNLITRKRGCVKLRFDKDYGPYGDICSENVDVADIVVGKYSIYGKEAEIYYQKQKCSVDELISNYPDKEAEIFEAFGYKRGTNSQMSRVVTYWECWFTYWDSKGKECEGVCWFLPNTDFILDKMPNPNWIPTGSDKNQKLINLTPKPIKPYIWLNYLNTGRSFIDETCLLDQAIPMQNILNKRGRQIVENADYANPRTLIDKRVMDESDAKKFVNKHPKTIGLVDTTETGNDIMKAVMQIPGQMLPSFVFEDKIDARSEIDVMMGTPSQFRGEQSQTANPTLGQDLLVKNQASALQDDLVDVVNKGWREYYLKLIQMCIVYLDDDYWVMTKGKDGDYVQISLHSENVDTNVRVSVQVDSTLPLDKQSQRATAIQLAQMPGRIDNQSLYEMLGLPDPDILAERTARSIIDPLGYISSLEQKMFNSEAETDIGLIVAGKIPDERDDYSEDYLNYWNLFMTTNRYMMIQQKTPDIATKLQNFLHAVANRASVTEGLRSSMLNPAGIVDQPVNPPAPKVDVRLLGQLDPGESAQKAGLPPPQAINGQQGISGGSPPKMQNPGQFGP